MVNNFDYYPKLLPFTKFINISGYNLFLCIISDYVLGRAGGFRRFKVYSKYHNRA